MALRMFALVGAVALVCVIVVAIYSYQLLGENQAIQTELARTAEQHGAHEPTLRAVEAAEDERDDRLAPAEARVVALLDEATANAAPADDPAGLVLYGVLLDEQAATVVAESMSVRVEGPGNANRWIKVEDGTFAFAGLSAGTWTLTATATGFDDHEQTLELTHAEPVQRLDIVMTRAVVIHVKLLTPDGSSLQQALYDAGGSSIARLNLSVVGTRERPTRDLPPISHRAYARYGIGEYASRAESYWLEDAMRDGFDGFLQLDEPLPAWASLVARHVILESQLIQPGTDELVFVVPLERVQAALGSVSLRVVDALSGAPVTDARVGLSTSQSSGGGTPVDADGQVVFEGQLPGLLDLRIRAQGYGSLRQVVSLPSGERLELGDMPLHPSTSVRGSLVDGDGQPVPRVIFRAHPVDGFARDFSLISRHSYRSDDEGRFEVTDLGRDQVVLRIVDEAWSGTLLVDAREGDVEDALLVAHVPTAVTFDPFWQAGSKRSLGLYTDAGTPLSAWPAFDGAWTSTQRLAPGAYQLVIDGAKPIAFEVGAEPMELALKP